MRLLAHTRLICRKIEQIVPELEHASERFSQLVQLFDHGGRASALECADPAGGLKKGRRLASDIAEVFLKRHIFPVAAAGLTDLAGAHLSDGTCQDHAGLVEILLCLRVHDARDEKISRVDSRVFSEFLLYGSFFPADRGVVYDVVVHERGQMGDLRHGGQKRQTGAPLFTARTEHGAQDEEHGTDPLSL